MKYFKAIGIYSVALLFVLYLIGNIASCSTKKRIGAECCDGTFSSSTGSGTCSWHGGVKRWRYVYWFSDYDEPYKSIFESIFTDYSVKNCEYD